ncbi:MAG: T9SS type A sorting domain-containing protein, partial [Bacteroidales bacterium]|nr:T9SS type A sorting domain-containing protein [Bacteroidales bacterium]
VYLSLFNNPSYYTDIQGEVCQGKFYYQNGFFEHMPGIHTRYLQTTEGCDSIINLHLTVNPIFSDTIYAQICQGEVYSENGFNFSVDTSGLYSLNLQSINGCDSIICLNLIVNEIVTPTNLTLNNIANYIELSWEGVGENYIIYRNNDSLAMTSIRTYQDSNVVEGVNYCYKIKALNGECESDLSNEECKTFLGINTIETNNFNAYLYPNPTNDKTILRVEDLKENALVRIYDLTGRLIKTLEINANDKELEIDVQNFTKGVYNIRICNSTINITKKLIVN